MHSSRQQQKKHISLTLTFFVVTLNVWPRFINTASKFYVAISSRFRFRAQIRSQTERRQTNSSMPLVMIRTHRLQPKWMWIINSPKTNVMQCYDRVSHCGLWDASRIHILTSTIRPMLAMCMLASLTVCSLSTCTKQHNMHIHARHVLQRHISNELHSHTLSATSRVCAMSISAEIKL